MRPAERRGAIALALASGLLAGACGGHSARTHEPLPAQLERMTAAPTDPGLGPSVSLDEAVSVEGYPGVPPFYVMARSSRGGLAACAACHTGPVTHVRAPAGQPRRAHWHVRLAHAGEAVMTCGTCHHLDDLSALRTLEGQPVAADHAYRVCAQCHAGTVADWAGGAHGKRAGGWAGPRVVYACSACHDPHRPAWDTRWPARAIRSE